MYFKNHRFTYYFTFFLLGSISYTSLLSHTTTLPNSTAFIEKIGDANLREALQRLEKGKKLQNYTPTELLKMGMQEGNKMALLITTYLVKVCRKRRLPIKKDVVMRYAIQHNASIKLITYLLENKIYNKKSLEGEVRYDLTTKFSFSRLLSNEVFAQKFIPEIVSSAISLISKVCTLLLILGFIFRFKRKYTENIKQWSAIGAFLQPIAYIIKFVVLIYYMLYRIGIKPGYLILALLSKRPKPVKEKLALLLLQYGADPNSRCFIIEYLPNTSKKPDVEAYYENHEPICARLFYAIHLAVRYDLLECVKELERRGAQLNPRAIYMEDKIDFSHNPPKEELITLSELYHNKNKNTKYTYSLDFAKPGSRTEQYLRRKGLVPTKKLQEEKEEEETSLEKEKNLPTVSA